MWNPTKKRTLSDVMQNFLLDIGLTLGVLVLLAEKATGEVIHEYVGVAFTAALLVHLLFHWDWIVATSKRLLKKTSGQVRIKSLINIAIFIDMAVIIVSGLLISEVVMRPFNLEVGSFWHALHVASSSLVIWLTGLHVAMSWKWIVNAIRQHVGQPIVRFFRRLVVRKPVAAHS